MSMIFSQPLVISQHRAGLKADFSEAFTPTLGACSGAVAPVPLGLYRGSIGEKLSVLFFLHLRLIKFPSRPTNGPNVSINIKL